ncbi:hypothetical protein [Dactylosporangium darangshiense]|uniref:hypothetical protein n=1 Tax=Dactylosporangium darangshiense TaxID=579108 RepID=UPI00362B1CA8
MMAVDDVALQRGDVPVEVQRRRQQHLVGDPGGAPAVHGDLQQPGARGPHPAEQRRDRHALRGPVGAEPLRLGERGIVGGLPEGGETRGEEQGDVAAALLGRQPGHLGRGVPCGGDKLVEQALVAGERGQQRREHGVSVAAATSGTAGAVSSGASMASPLWMGDNRVAPRCVRQPIERRRSEIT